MPRPKRNPTRIDKQRDREAGMVLASQGHTQADIARMLQTPLSTVKMWAREDGWTATFERAGARANHCKPAASQTIRKVAFDLAKTGKKTRGLLAKTAYRTARYASTLSKSEPQVIFENASQLASLTKATAQIHNWGSETPQNRFSVDVKIGAIASKAGEIRELTAEEVLEIESETDE